jgi:hypothetical protein
VNSGSLPNRPTEPAQAPAATPQPIAIARSYDDLRRAVADWCDHIGMTRAELDAEAGLAEGHAGKLLAARARKRLSMLSLGRIMAAVGLVLIVAVDSQGPPRACLPRKSHAKHWRDQRGSKWGKRMAARRALALTAGQRSEIARNAAVTRWQRRQQTSPARGIDAAE